MLFDDRAWGWKFAAALALLAGLGVLSERQGRDANPAYWVCLVRPERYDGKLLWIHSAVVTSRGPGGFRIQADRLDIEVRGDADVAPGDRVSLRGHFRASDGRVDLVAWRVIGPLARFRWLVELVSLIVLAGVAWNFLRHFAFRRETLRVELRD